MQTQGGPQDASFQGRSIALKLISDTQQPPAGYRTSVDYTQAECIRVKSFLLCHRTEKYHDSTSTSAAELHLNSIIFKFTIKFIQLIFLVKTKSKIETLKLISNNKSNDPAA